MSRRVRIVCITLASVAGAWAAVALWIAAPLPPELAAPGPIPSVTLLDRSGVLLRTTRAPDGTRGGFIPLGEIDPKVWQAFLAMEDRRFYDHGGVEYRALARALRDDIRAGHVVAGGSTITMQLARLLRGTPRSAAGKVSQILWARRLEAHLDKERILELYLNRVPLGQGASGVAAGAALYFDADARELSLGQAAMLGALARAPSRDNPLAAPERARARRALTLRRMVELGFARPADAHRAAEEPLIARDRRTGSFAAPHFTTRVLQESRGSDGTWRTTLDLGLQSALESEVRHTVAVLHDRIVAHAAVVVLDNPTGEVLAWVGSPDFWADTAGQVDMVVSPRQPGSALKPFLYGLALDRGYTPASVLPDLPHTYRTTLGPYRPRNYDRRFHGPVRAREALASSYNIPAVELAERLGIGSLYRTLHLAGFASLDHGAEYYGLGLALGNGDVTLLELANGYRALANGGLWTPVRWNGDAGSDTPAETRRVMTTPAAALVLDMLSDPVARVPAFGLETPLDFAFPAAAKTGTSRHFTDNWAVATTGRFTVAVWVGNFNGRPMQGVGGITGAGPLLHRAVLLTARAYPPGVLPTPRQAGAVALRVCRLSGLRATPDCPQMVEWFVPGTQPDRDCDWHRDGSVVLPVEYAEWRTTADVEANPAVVPRGETAFRITSPQDGDRYGVPVGVDGRYATLALRAAGGGSELGVRWFVDGRETRESRWQLTPGAHTIRAETPRGERAEVHIGVQ
jgi:penicillin-binding protein 1C